MATHKPGGGTDYPQDFPKLDDSVERVLSRADALLARSRGAGRGRDAPGPPVADPPSDFPVLTEVIAGPPKPPTAQDLMLDQMENELRLELLNQLGPELERLIETNVHAHLEASVEAIMASTRDQLVTEVRRAVREVLGQVLGDEIKRLRGPRPKS